jgi:prepilin-type N-terminal cleavage/methylation domain-containing protein
MRAKKGFTLVELIVVIAMIAVLAAIILPNISSDKSRIQAANIAARDFYSSVQYCFTKYMKYEAELSIEIAKDTESQKYITYQRKLNGNYPTGDYTYVEMRVEQNLIKYVHVRKSLSELLLDTSEASDTAFERLLANDIDNVLETSTDGYYFAVIEYKDTSTVLSDATATVKVQSAFYSQWDIAPVTGETNTFREENLLFIEDNILANGNICGSCTSAKDVNNRRVGTVGTYFMNVSADLTLS